MMCWGNERKSDFEDGVQLENPDVGLLQANA